MELKDGYDKFCDADIDATISEFLKKMKQPFSLHSIMKSERRVLKTIKFKLGVSVLTYVEHLLLLLAQHNSKVDLEVMYTTIIQVVDITYLLHEEIYLLLFNKMTGRWEKSAEEK
uniref:Uncharacterized protein n=1 Tax=Timema bartmani TaxID=61472 RepID=A0A7R9HVC9_9NEOP|nr:unnamed protein product [Timema bartmani]